MRSGLQGQQKAEAISIGNSQDCEQMEVLPLLFPPESVEPAPRPFLQPTTLPSAHDSLQGRALNPLVSKLGSAFQKPLYQVPHSSILGHGALPEVGVGSGSLKMVGL